MSHTSPDGTTNTENIGGIASVANGKNAKVTNKQKIETQTNNHFELVFTPGKGSSVGEEKPQYTTKWSWKSPLTQASLTWIGTITGLLGLLQGYGLIAPLVLAIVGGFKNPGRPPHAIPLMQPLVFTFMATVVVFVLTLSMRRIVRHRLRTFGSWKLLPAAIAVDGRFALARFVGKCPTCGGRLEFYNKAVDWEYVPKPKGGQKKVVTEREMTAECVRNPKRHAWYVDTAEERVDA